MISTLPRTTQLLATLLALGCTTYRYMTPAVTADGRVLLPYAHDGASGMLECRLPDKVFTPGARMECVEIEVVERGRPAEKAPATRPPVAVQGDAPATDPKALPAAPASGKPGPLAWVEGDWVLLLLGADAKGPAAHPVHLSAAGAGEVALSTNVDVPRWRQGACGSATTVRIDATYTLRVGELDGKLTASLSDPRIKKSSCADVQVDPGLGASTRLIKSGDGRFLVADRLVLARAGGLGSSAVAPPPDSGVIAERWTLSTLEAADAAVLQITAVGNGLGGTWTASRNVAVPTWKRSACGNAAELTAVEKCTLEGRLSGAEVALSLQSCKVTGCPCDGVCKDVTSVPRSFRAWVTSDQKHLVGSSLLLTRE